MPENGFIDESNYCSDWLKTRWTWPAYKSDAFYKRLQAEKLTLKKFQLFQMYVNAVRTGLIVDDKWTGSSVELNDVWLSRDFSVDEQIRVRFAELFEQISWVISDAQADAARALTKEETGEYVLNFIQETRTAGLSGDVVTVEPFADVSGIEGLRPVDQMDAWVPTLLNFSGPFVQAVTANKLPQVWVKSGARAVYYPGRKLIVVPGLTGKHFPHIVHAACHFFETIGVVSDAVTMMRNSHAYPGTLHMIRGGLYALRGPWVDQYDGAVLGHNVETMEKWYHEGREFSAGEIASLFDDKHTEYFAMAAQRIARGDLIDIADMWSRHPAQLLTYMCIAAGNMMENPYAV